MELSDGCMEEYGYSVFLVEGEHLEAHNGLEFVTVSVPESRLTLTWWDLQ